MAQKFNARLLVNELFDVYEEVFVEEAQSTRKEQLSRVKREYSKFFKDIISDIGASGSGPYTSFADASWNALSEKWQDTKAGRGGGDGFFYDTGGLLADLKRRSPNRTYGEPKIRLKNPPNWQYGTSQKDAKTRLTLVVFPKIGTAVSNLIRPFSKRTQSILRFNEPFAVRGSAHGRGLIQPAFAYYLDLLAEEFYGDGRTRR